MNAISVNHMSSKIWHFSQIHYTKLSDHQKVIKYIFKNIIKMMNLTINLRVKELLKTIFYFKTFSTSIEA